MAKASPQTQPKKQAKKTKKQPRVKISDMLN